MFLSPQKLWLHVSVLSLREEQSATPHHYSFICSNCKDELTANVAVSILKIYNTHHHCCRYQCKKITQEKAHYLLELYKQMNTGSSCELQKQTKNSTHAAVNCMWINSLVHFPNHCWLRHVQHHTTPCHLTQNGDDSDDDRESHLTSKGPMMTMQSCPLSRRFLVKMMRFVFCVSASKYLSLVCFWQCNRSLGKRVNQTKTCMQIASSNMS